MDNILKETRNSKVLKDFAKYCEEHPEHRFWQALRNWSGYSFILVSNIPPGMPSGTIAELPQQADTFYWEGKRA